LDSDEKPEKPKVSSGEAVEARENDKKPLFAESAPNTQNHTIGDPTAAGFWDDVEWCSIEEPYGYSRGEWGCGWMIHSNCTDYLKLLVIIINVYYRSRILYYIFSKSLIVYVMFRLHEL